MVRQDFSIKGIRALYYFYNLSVNPNYFKIKLSKINKMAHSETRRKMTATTMTQIFWKLILTVIHI